MNKSLNDILCSKFFLLFSCSIIFLLSIFLRSTIDIGSDTGIYLALGKKVAQGGRYYYDFFESNFPISFYFYAAEYHLSNFFHIDPIITSEIVINLLAILSISWSAKILQKTTLYDNKAHYNLMIVAYMLGFFLRIGALEVGEFGTKSSFLLICLYPYLSFSFERKDALTKSEMIFRGSLMGLIGCLKPHYLVFIILIELDRFWKNKSFRFFLELDKLIMLLIGTAYLVFMVQVTSEFFEFMVPMWRVVYSSYDDTRLFLDNLLFLFTSKVMIYAFIFLIFSRLNFSQNDKVLTLLFGAVSLLILLENIGTTDQISIFYAVITLCFSKFVYDLLMSPQFSFREHQFIIISLMLLPMFDLEILPWSIFSIAGFINIWWFIAFLYPFIFLKRMKKKNISQWHAFKKQRFVKYKLIGLCLCYFVCLISTIIALVYFSKWTAVAINLTSLFVILFCFERFYACFYPRFSPFLICVVIIILSYLIYSYVVSLSTFLQVEKKFYQSPSALSERIVHYSKIHAPEKKDGILVFSDLNDHQFPIINYLGKDNYLKRHLVETIATDVGEKTIFEDMDEHDKMFTLTYFFEDLKEQMKADDIKILFINAGPDMFKIKDRCLVGYLEYYYLDPEFRKIFLSEFHYEGRIVSSTEIKPSKIKNFEKGNALNNLKSSTQKVVYDFEVYVRND